MTGRHVLALAYSLPLLALACGASEDSAFLGGDDVANGDHGGSKSGTGAAPEEAAGPVPPSTTLPGVDASAPTSGLLTAGAWDDNANFDRWTLFRNTRADAFPLGLQEQQDAHALWQVTPVAKQTLDVSLLIDTTGSMGDELTYLTREFDALAASIHGKYPNAAQRWSLVLYRDVGDDYIERHFDFESNLGAFRESLAAQNAGGGGDFPEAAERGLEAMNALQWRSDATTAKLAFWLADAPPHTENLQKTADAFRAAKDLGVHLYPVASSGADAFAEYVMRAGAQLTGGRFLFLTDDSGIGGEHLEPKVPCYWVTKLNDAILRVVDHELTGIHREPTAAEILRQTGNPVGGVCATDGGSATAY